MRLLRGFLWFVFFITINSLAAGLVVVAIVYQKLPELTELENYRPRLPLLVFDSEKKLLGEFGEEHRTVVPYHQYPKSLINALLATEDVRFFEHAGIDLIGIARAAWGYFLGRREGASTITMQVARNFYLRRDRTPERKLVEILLALKIEQQLSKQEILERYMNQIYLGGGSYGFVAAAREYYNKKIDELNTAEISVLVGLPKAPSGFNPRRFPSRAKSRQNHILSRMRSVGMIDEETYLELLASELPPLGKSARQLPGVADYVAEEVRKTIYKHFGEETYERGFRVYTTIRSDLQKSAVQAVQSKLIDYQERQPYQGPEQFIDIDRFTKDDYIEALSAIPVIGSLKPALVTRVTKNELDLIDQSGNLIQMQKEELGRIKKHLLGGRKPILQPGAVVRTLETEEEKIRLASLPEAQAALVALSSDDGAILAMVGGFDFSYNQFNNVTQARRQPGSAIKPFIYSAALEKGLMPATILPDTPVFLSAKETGNNETWQPKNYDGIASGPITMRRALAKSKNLATIQLIKHITPFYARDYLLRFGFKEKDQPPYLTLALGVGVVTPIDLARGYAVFANGGYLVTPNLITRIEDYDGNVIVNEFDYRSRRIAIDKRNAFIMIDLLREVVSNGTGVRAKKLGRNDLAGKTGTTNDTRDAWFAGFGGDITAVSWVGRGDYKSLGNKETGSRAALPIWIDFMRDALAQSLESEYTVPSGIITAEINPDSGKILPAGHTEESKREYFYTEFLPAETQAPPSKLIEDLF